jgi:hypothetical protein
MSNESHLVTAAGSSREEQLEDIASDLFSELCEGDGEHSERLDRALILKHLKRAAAGSSAPPQEWQPIETAPKDGTEVLVLGHERIRVAINRGRGWLTVPGAWAVTPTHWQPLPTPPGSDRSLTPESDEKT